MTHQEERTGVQNVGSGDSGTAFDLVTCRDEATLSLEDLAIGYNSSGSASARVQLHDAPEGTSAGSLPDPSEEYRVEPGAFEYLSGLSRDNYQDDIILVVQNNDSDVTVTAGTCLVTG